jgi:hypothetical protein
MVDKRRYPRIPFREPIHFVVKQGGARSEEVQQQEGSCLSCDLSPGGLCLRLEDFLPLHTELNLDFRLDRDQYIEAEGQVVWIQKIPHAENYQIGIQFDRSQHYFLNREIHKYLESQGVSAQSSLQNDN